MVCLLLFTLSGLTFGSASENSQPQIFRKAVAYPPTSLDPIYGNTVVDGAVRIELFEPLLTINSQQQAVAAAAASMEVSSDGLYYRFELRDDLHWSDGRPVTAEDFKTSIIRMIDPQIGLEGLPKIRQIALLLKNADAIRKGRKAVDEIGVRIINQRQFVLTLSQPLIIFDRLLADSLYPTPSHLLGEHGEYWSRQANLVSNGPYRLLRSSDNSTVLEKNPYYRNQSSLFFDRVAFMVLSAQQFERKLQSKEIDAFFNYDMMANRVWLAKQLDYRPYYISAAPKTLLLFNTLDAKLVDSDVRRALQLATFSDQLVSRLRRHFSTIEPLYCLLYSEEGIAERIRPAWWNWSPQQRIASARQLMTTAGYSDARPLRLRLSRFQEQTMRLIGNALQEQWSTIGVELEIIEQPTKQHYTQLIAGNYQVGLANWEDKFSDPLATLSLLQSASESNLTGWRSKQYDQLFERIAQLKPGPDRTRLIEKTQLVILQEGPLIPLISNLSDPAYISSDIRLPKNDKYIQARHASRQTISLK